MLKRYSFTLHRLSLHYLMIASSPLLILSHFSFSTLTLSKNSSSLSHCPVLSILKMKCERMRRGLDAIMR